MEETELTLELRVMSTELHVLERKLEEHRKTHETTPSSGIVNYFYSDLNDDIKEKLTQIFELKDNFTERPGKFFTKIYRRIHTLRDRLVLYRNHSGEALQVEIEKRKKDIDVFVDHVNGGLTNEQGHEALDKIGTHFNNTHICNLGKETFFKVLNLKPTLIGYEKNYQKDLEIAAEAKTKAKEGFQNYLKELELSSLEVITTSQPEAIKAYLSYCEIINTSDNLKGILRDIRTKSKGSFYGMHGTLHRILTRIIEAKEERARLILVELGVPEDSIEIAISKGIFWATKNEYLKDFSNILKLIDAKKQADFIRYNIGDLNDDHVGSINDTIKTYFRDNDLLDLSEEDMKKLVIEKFGLTKSFSVFGRRGHWRTNYQTGIKDIWINAHPVVKFVIK